MFHPDPDPDPDPDELPLVALADDGAAVAVSGCVPVPDPTGLLLARTPREEEDEKEVLQTKKTHHRKRTASRTPAERDGEGGLDVDERIVIFIRAVQFY
jgi:hypothetical protein